MSLALSLPGRAGGQPRSQQERLWLIGGSLAAFLLLLVGYFLLISPQRSDTSAQLSQLSAARQQNAVLQARINTLREQNKSLAKYQAAYAEARKALPTTSGVSDFLRSLQALGNATLTDVSSLKVGQPTSMTAAAPAPAGNYSAGHASSAAPAPAAATNAAPATGTIYALAIDATISGSPAALGKFLDQLQRVQPRAVLITSLNQSATQTAGGRAGANAPSTLHLSMQAFVAPSSAAEAATLAQQAGQ